MPKKQKWKKMGKKIGWKKIMKKSEHESNSKLPNLPNPEIKVFLGGIGGGSSMHRQLDRRTPESCKKSRSPLAVARGDKKQGLSCVVHAILILVLGWMWVEVQASCEPTSSHRRCLLLEPNDEMLLWQAFGVRWNPFFWARKWSPQAQETFLDERNEPDQCY